MVRVCDVGRGLATDGLLAEVAARDAAVELEAAPVAADATAFVGGLVEG